MSLKYFHNLDYAFFKLFNNLFANQLENELPTIEATAKAEAYSALIIMIAEFIRYLTTPATSAARSLGQVQEVIAMDARYKRSRKQWNSHLSNSQKFIENSTQNIQADRDIVVLGSGLLLDIPINYLASRFRHIYLLDVVHLNSVKKITAQYNNVSLIQHDITGLSESLVNADKNGMEKLNVPEVEIPCLNNNTGLVISANMLSQIYLAPICHAEKKLHYSDKQLKHLTNEIISAHLNMLKRLKCQVCLITDNKRFYRDRQQRILNSENILADLILPEPDSSWYWEIAPLGELDKKYSMSSQVHAFSNFNNAILSTTRNTQALQKEELPVKYN